MVEPAELRPEELDRLEDALELLEFADTDDPSPVVRHRLGEFRKILQLSRTALPMVEVPHGILDRVMAEARQAAEVPALTPAVAHPPAAEPQGFWAKMRRFALVPGVALAGAAALVLIMVERSPETTVSSGELHEGIARVESKSAPAISDGTRAADAMPAQGGEAPTPTAGALAPGATPEPAAVMPVAPPPASAAPTAAPELEYDKKGKADLDRAESLSAEQKPTEEEQEDSPTLDDGNTPRWDIIARGDRARHKGDCDAARIEYKLALGDADARVRSRAHAGIGLCSAADGESNAADSAYKAARELDPEISGFIETERPRGGGSGTGSSNAARAAKSKKKAAPQQQQAPNAEALDPFDPAK